MKAKRNRQFSTKLYILSIDTETSGIPSSWDIPYDKEQWPYTLQIAWTVSDRAGQEIKTENHYICNPAVDLDSLSTENTSVHSITAEILKEKGIALSQALQILRKDIQMYDPLVIGHFILLDYHMIGVECYRSGINHLLRHQPLYCTMIGTTRLAEQYSKSHLRLIDLYQILFAQPQPQPHDALYDATATAKCYFELLKNNYIDEQSVYAQYPVKQDKEYDIATIKIGWAVLFIIIMLLITMAIEWYKY